MRRVFLSLALVAVGGLLVLGLSAYQVCFMDGDFELTVNVTSSADPLRSVSCEAFGSREDAGLVLEQLCPPQTDLWSAVADPFAGGPLTLRVPFSITSRKSLFSQSLKRFQFRHLVVLGKLEDGRRVGGIFEIPDSRLSREVSVTLP